MKGLLAKGLVCESGHTFLSWWNYGISLAILRMVILVYYTHTPIISGHLAATILFSPLQVGWRAVGGAPVRATHLSWSLDRPFSQWRASKDLDNQMGTENSQFRLRK